MNRREERLRIAQLRPLGDTVNLIDHPGSVLAVESLVPGYDSRMIAPSPPATLQLDADLMLQRAAVLYADLERRAAKIVDIVFGTCLQYYSE